MKNTFCKTKTLVTLAVTGMLAGTMAHTIYGADVTDSVTGASYKQYQLNECLNAAKSNPLVLKRFMLENDIAVKSLHAVRADNAPSISAFSTGILSSRSDITPIGVSDNVISRESLRAGVDMNYTLYDAGANRASVNAAKAAIDEVNATHRSTVIDLLDQTAVEYYAVLYYQRISESDNDKINALQENMRTAKGRFDIGTVTKADLLNAQSALSLAGAVKEEDEQSLYSERVKLANLIGLNPEKTLPVVVEPAQESSISDTVTQLSETTLKSHPQIAKAAALQNSAIAERDLVKAQNKINITLNSSAGVGMRYRGWNLTNGISDPYVAAIVRVQLPLYNGGKSKALLQKQEENIKLQELLSQDIQNQLKVKILQAYSLYKTAGAKIKPSEDSVAASEEVYKLAKGRYSAALGTQRDVLDALHQLTLNRLTLAQNIYNRDLAINNLRRLAGIDGDIAVP